MNHPYSDITARLGSPWWWDEHAVPRYCPFGPRENADIYANEVALLLVACQDCGHEFKVCLSAHQMDNRPLASLIEKDEIHYGDPPNYGCCAAGPTMNSVPLRVLEFWVLDRRSFDWERCPELEGAIRCDWVESGETERKR